jgi:hypothetical protein
MNNQLTLFDISEKYFIVSYWAHPFDKNGNEIKNVMCKWVEEKSEYKLSDFIHMLKLVDCKNIQILNKLP